MQFNCTPPLLDVMVALKLEIISSISIGLDIIENVTITPLKFQLYSVFISFSMHISRFDKKCTKIQL